MNLTGTSFALSITLLTFPIGSDTLQAAPAPAKPFRQTSFAEVTAQLDSGGSVFLYLSLDQWLTGLSGKVDQFREFVQNLPEGLDEEDKQNALRAFDTAKKVVQESGVESFSGVGVSGIQIGPELHRTRFILHHPRDESGFLMELFGKAPHEQAGLKMLPTTAALAGFGDFDAERLWRLVESTMKSSGVEPLQEAAGAWPETFEAQSGLKWNDVMASLGGELGFLLDLDEEKTFIVPVEDHKVEIPLPSALFAIKVNNSLLYDHAAGMMSENPDAVVSEEGGLKMVAVPLPLPLPMPVKLALASNGDYLFIASSPDLVRKVQAVLRGETPGLTGTEKFQALAQHLDLKGNSFSYLDKRFTQAFLDIQQQFITAGDIPEEQMKTLQSLFGGNRADFALSSGAHTPIGWQSTSVGSQDSAQMLIAAPMVAVVAIGAGLTLPAIAQAKVKAQEAADMNQVKQLALAAHFYADKNGTLPPAATWGDELDDFLDDKTVFKARHSDNDAAVSFAFNTALGGKAFKDLAASSDTVLIFEAEGAWNLHGGRDTLASAPRHHAGYIIGFADGSVRRVKAEDLDDLIWTP